MLQIQNSKLKIQNQFVHRTSYFVLLLMVFRFNEGQSEIERRQ